MIFPSVIILSLSVLSLLASSATAGIVKYPKYPNNPKGDRMLLGGIEIKVEHVLQQEDWRAYKDKCSPQEFNLHLFVDTHVFLLASPAQADTGCEALVFHSTTTNGNDEANDKRGHEKEALVLEDAGVVSVLQEQSIALGVYSFQDIARAFDQADPDAVGMVQHDLLLNNCGDFAKNFGALLGIALTPDTTESIVQRLLQHGGDDFLISLRNNEHFAIIADGGDSNLEDEEVVTRLVESRTHELYV